MKQYKIYAGLGGGFGGAQHLETAQFANESDANDYAYQLALQEYQSYEGMHGLYEFADIYENPTDFGLDEDCTEDEAHEAYLQEVESWIEYWVEVVE